MEVGKVNGFLEKNLVVFNTTKACLKKRYIEQKLIDQGIKREEEKMKKKIICAFLAAALTASMTASVSVHAEDTASVLKDGENTTLTIMWPGNSSAPASLEQVEAAFNEIVQETIDCTVEFNIVEWGVYDEQLNLVLSSGEPYDVVFMYSNINNAINSGQVCEISDLVDTYAPGVLEAMGSYVDACRIGDELFGLPTYRDYAAGSGLICRTDMLEELNIDPETVTTWEDVEGILAQVKENYPDYNVLVPADIGKGVLYFYTEGIYDALYADMIGVYTDGSDGLTVHNIYATDEYKEMAEVAYDWNQKGYFIADSTTVTDARQTFLKAGNTFGYIGKIHPGTKTNETLNSGVEVTTIPITHQGIGTNSVAGCQFVVPQTCDSPEKAVALMELFYTNTELQNLIRYGIEGVDYVVTEDGVADYPEGITADNAGWLNQSWLTGNAALSYPWVSEGADIWEQYKAFNDGANFSPAYGFMFDASNVKNEISAVSNVLEKYKAMIESGMADPAESIPSFNEELEAAGIQAVIDEAQAQVDAWSAQ